MKTPGEEQKSDGAGPTSPGSTPPKESEYPAFAGFWLRLLASSLDAALMMLGSVPFTILSAALMGLFGSSSLIGSVVLGFAPFVLYLIFMMFFYHALFESSRFRGTPGKLFLNIHVVDMEENQISFPRAFVRNLLRCVSAIPFGVGYLAAAFTANKQAWHDSLASTLVVRKELPPAWRIIVAIIVSVSVAGLGIYNEERKIQKRENLRWNQSEVEISAPRSLSPALEPTPAPTPTPQPTAAMGAAADVVVEVDGKPLALTDFVTIWEDFGRISFGFFRTPLSDEDRAAILRTKDPDAGSSRADVVLTLAPLGRKVPCRADDLMSYTVAFRPVEGLVSLPDGLPQLEFTKAMMSKNTREGVGLSCVADDGKKFLLMIPGSGTSPYGRSTKFSWHFAISTELQ